MTTATRVTVSEHHRALRETTIPVYQIPDQRVRIRPTGRCQFCAGSVFDIRWPFVDAERQAVTYRGSVICLLCGRTCAELKIGGGA